MINRIEHIGIAVNDAAESIKLFNKLLGAEPYKEEMVESEGVKTVFYHTSGGKIELLAGTSPDSPISRFIEKKGEGIHHIAFEVDDIYAEIARLKKEGFSFISETPKPGADNKIIVFIHPKSANGVLVELCQGIK